MKKRHPHPEVANILRSIDEAYDHAAWHGPNLRSALRGVTTAQAAWRPAPRRHNIWELAVHAAYWKYTVRRRCTGAKRGDFAERGSNWFHRPGAAREDATREASANEKAWRQDLALLELEHRRLRESIAAVDPNLLHQPFDRQGRPLVAHILGTAFHDVYHAGQIQLLKRLQPPAPRRLKLAGG